MYVEKAMTDRGANPLCIAAGNGHEGVVAQLLKAAADANKAIAGNGATPLCIAARHGLEGVAEQLLKAEADPNTEMTRGRSRTPVISACVNCHSKVCSLLLEAGANVDHSTDGTNGGPALMYAVAHGHQEVTLVLMERRASSGNGILTPPMPEDLNEWMAEALAENRRIVAENNRQMKVLVQRIPEWCAQAASSVAAEVQNDGSSISNAPAPPHPSCAGRQRKALPTPE